MSKMELLDSRYRDFIAAAEALHYVDRRVLTGFFEYVTRFRIQVKKDLLMELAEEAGVSVKYEGDEAFIHYGGTTIFTLVSEGEDGTP
jgi:hypothetical protein